MQDPAFKKLFSHPVTVEKLVRTYSPDRAAEIDFSTLEKMDAELVGEALVRRYPDMLWRARSLDGARQVVILLEFQGRQDWFMSLRVAIYALLAVQALLRRTGTPRHGSSLDVLAFVIFHGRGRWRAPTALGELFGRWVPGEFRVVSRARKERQDAIDRIDLPATILELEKVRSVEGTLAALAALQRVAKESGGEYNRFMAECVGQMLVSKKRITEEQMKGATTMEQVDIEYQRSLEKFGRKWFRQGRDEGIRQGRDEGMRQGRDEGMRQGRDEGEFTMLCQMVSKKFGQATAEELTSMLAPNTNDTFTSTLANAVIECDTPEGFLTQVRRMLHVQ